MWRQRGGGDKTPESVRHGVRVDEGQGVAAVVTWRQRTGEGGGVFK